MSNSVPSPAERLAKGRAILAAQLEERAIVTAQLEERKKRKRERAEKRELKRQKREGNFSKLPDQKPPLDIITPTHFFSSLKDQEPEPPIPMVIESPTLASNPIILETPLPTPIPTLPPPPQEIQPIQFTPTLPSIKPQKKPSRSWSSDSMSEDEYSSSEEEKVPTILSRPITPNNGVIQGRKENLANHVQSRDARPSQSRVFDTTNQTITPPISLPIIAPPDNQQWIHPDTLARIKDTSMDMAGNAMRNFLYLAGASLVAICTGYARKRVEHLRAVSDARYTHGNNVSVPSHTPPFQNQNIVTYEIDDNNDEDNEFIF